MTREELKDEIYNRCTCLMRCEIDQIFKIISESGFAIVPRSPTNEMMQEIFHHSTATPVNTEINDLWYAAIKAGDVVGK